jgi:hypothetical protein
MGGEGRLETGVPRTFKKFRNVSKIPDKGIFDHVMLVIEVKGIFEGVGVTDEREGGNNDQNGEGTPHPVHPSPFRN